MSNQNKRATIYFDPDIHLALRLKAAETDRSVSELVNEAVGREQIPGASGAVSNCILGP